MYSTGEEERRERGDTNAIWLALGTQTCAFSISNVSCSFYSFVRFLSKVTYIVHSFMSRLRHLAQGCLHVFFEHWGSNPEPFIPNFLPTPQGFEGHPQLTSAVLHLFTNESQLWNKCCKHHFGQDNTSCGDLSRLSGSSSLGNQTRLLT